MLYLEIVNQQCILTSKGRLEPKSFDGCTEQEVAYNRSIERSERRFIRNEATIASLVLLRNYSYVRFRRWSLGPMKRCVENQTTPHLQTHQLCISLALLQFNLNYSAKGRSSRETHCFQLTYQSIICHLQFQPMLQLMPRRDPTLTLESIMVVQILVEFVPFYNTCVINNFTTKCKILNVRNKVTKTDR